MRVAITGATGFLGGYVIEALAEAGYEPLALGRGGPALEAKKSLCTVRETDYKTDSLAAALEGAQAVIHLAGRRMLRSDDPLNVEPFVDPNILLVDRLITACARAGTRRIVFASTIAVYSPCDLKPYREELTCCPINAYGWSKLCAEQVLTLRTANSPVSAVSLRVAAAYGHGERDSAVLMKFSGLAAAKKTLILTGNPRTGIDYLYARDIAAAMHAAVTTSKDGVYNVGAGRTFSVEEMAQACNEIFDNIGNYQVKNPASPSTPDTRMDISRTLSDLNWKPAYSLRDGLADMRRRLEATAAGQRSTRP